MEKFKNKMRKSPVNHILHFTANTSLGDTCSRGSLRLPCSYPFALPLQPEAVLKRTLITHHSEFSRTRPADSAWLYLLGKSCFILTWSECFVPPFVAWLLIFRPLFVGNSTFNFYDCVILTLMIHHEDLERTNCVSFCLTLYYNTERNSWLRMGAQWIS